MYDGSAEMPNVRKELEKLEVGDIAYPQSELGIAAHPIRQLDEVGVRQRAAEVDGPRGCREWPQHLGRQR
jgi:hypothetical protein